MGTCSLPTSTIVYPHLTFRCPDPLKHRQSSDAANETGHRSASWQCAESAELLQVQKRNCKTQAKKSKSGTFLNFSGSSDLQGACTKFCPGVSTHPSWMHFSDAECSHFLSVAILYPYCSTIRDA